MQSTTARVTLAVALVAIAAVLFVVLRDDGGGEDGKATTADQTRPQAGGEGGGQQATPQSRVPVIVVRGGEPVGGVQELGFTKGDVIRFSVRSDVADEVHFHGYDVSKEVKAGGGASFAVPAEIDGVFEVELEELAEPIAEITVNPG